VTDARGRYQLREVPPGPQHVRVERIGYRARTVHALVPPFGVLTIDRTLRAEPVPLAGITARAPPAAADAVVGDPPLAERGLTPAALRDDPLLGEPDALAALSGGVVVVAPEMPAGVHIRGGATDHTAFTMDGIPILNPVHAAGVFGAWNPDAHASRDAGQWRVVVNGRTGQPFDSLFAGSLTLREHLVGEVGGDLHQATRVAGGADATALAGERDESLGGASVAADPGEAMGQDAATEVRAEVALDPVGHAVAIRIGVGGAGEEGLEMVLHDRVERRGCGLPSAVHGREAGGPCLVRRLGFAASG